MLPLPAEEKQPALASLKRHWQGQVKTQASSCPGELSQSAVVLSTSLTLFLFLQRKAIPFYLVEQKKGLRLNEMTRQEQFAESESIKAAGSNGNMLFDAF